MENAVFYQFAAIINFLLSPFGIMALVLMPVIVIAALATRSTRWTLVTIIFWLATFGVVAPLPWYTSTLIFPLEQLRSLGKPLCMTGMILLLPAAFFAHVRNRPRLPTAPMVAYFSFLIIITLRVLSAGFRDRALGQLLAYVLTFCVFGVGMTRWVETHEDGRRILKCIVWAALLLVGGSLLQVIVSSRDVIWQGRFFGTAVNPQFIGSTLALCFVPAICLLTDSKENVIWRVTLLGTIGFMIVCMVWSGSRTAVMGAALNVVLFYRLRLGRFLVGGIVVALSLLLAVQFFADSFANSGRLLSLEDTRSAAWRAMYANFLRNPFTGSVDEGFGYQENTYLAVAGEFGMIGLVPGFITLVLGFNTARKMLTLRAHVGRAGPLCDVVFSGLITYAVICIFDSYPLATIGFHTFYLYGLLVLAGLLQQMATAETAEELPGYHFEPE